VAPTSQSIWGMGVQGRSRLFWGKERYESSNSLHSIGWALASAALRLAYLSTGIAASFCAPMARSLLR
jgi:hypothetical protein